MQKKMADYSAISLVEVDYGDIEFFEKCGGGAFGSVYRAKWKSKDKVVAVKKVLLLEKEAQVLCTLRHKNIIQFYGAVTIPPNYCLVTEYAPNGSLYYFLSTHQGEQMLDLSNILKWAVDIALGMNYLHTGAPVKVLHRDLKSKNVVISEEFVCKICDFGASKFHGSTTRMSFAGTLPWMAPEVIQCLPTSEACDIWSYGVVLWELLTHEVPFKGIEGFQVAWLVVEKDERLTIPKTCPHVMGRIMMSTWNKDPKKRPQFSSILRQLERLQNDQITLGSLCSSYLKHRNLWKAEIQSTLDRIKNKEKDLNLKLQKLQDWERRLEEKEISLEKQQYLQKLHSYDVNMWSENDVHFWLKQMADNNHLKDLARYADLLLQNNISGRLLLLLNQEDLRRMGVVSIGHLISLQSEIERLHAQNKRMMDFPPLEQLSLDAPSYGTEMPSQSRLKIVLLFGNHIRRGASEQEHKWKMYVEVDENDNPTAMACIKKVAFRHQDSEQVIQQAPFVMERWSTGISSETKVECTVTYQTHVKKPKQTRYCHKVKLDGCKVHQREVELILKKSVLRLSQCNSPKPSSSKASPQTPSSMWDARNRIVNAPVPSPPRQNLWAKVVAAGITASPLESPKAGRKFSLPNKESNVQLGIPQIHRTISAPCSPFNAAVSTEVQSTESPHRYHSYGRYFKPKLRLGKKKKHLRADMNEDAFTATQYKFCIDEATKLPSDDDHHHHHHHHNHHMHTSPRHSRINFLAPATSIEKHDMLPRPRPVYHKSSSDSGVQLSPEIGQFKDVVEFAKPKTCYQIYKHFTSNMPQLIVTESLSKEEIPKPRCRNHFDSSNVLDDFSSPDLPVKICSRESNINRVHTQQSQIETEGQTRNGDDNIVQLSMSSHCLKYRPPKGRGFRGIGGFHRSLNSRSRGRT